MSIIHYATTIDFGPGALNILLAQCIQLGITRPLIVTDTGMARTGIPDQALSALSTLRPAMFDGINPNPAEAEVMAGVAVYQAIRADGLVAIGGGSAIDGAKAIALLISNGGTLADYGRERGMRRTIESPLPPLIAVPTIAGSGSEISRGLGVGVGASGAKVNILHPFLFPKLALCDPALTLGVPTKLGVLSALDALSHCIEGYVSPVYNPPIAAIALDGATRLYRNLVRLRSHPKDLEVRREIMMGAIEGGMSMPKGLGPAHGIGIPLDRLHLSHGAIIARLLPKVVRWYGPAVQERSAEICTALGLEDTDLARALEALNASLGVHGGLADLGVPWDIIDQIASEAARSPYAGICLRDAQQADYAELLTSAM